MSEAELVAEVVETMIAAVERRPMVVPTRDLAPHICGDDHPVPCPDALAQRALLLDVLAAPAVVFS